MKNVLFGSCVELFIWWRHLKILCSGILDEREDLEDDEEEEGSPFDFTG